MSPSHSYWQHKQSNSLLSVHSWPHLWIFHIVQHVSVTNFSSSDQSCPCSSSAEPMVGSSQGSVRVVLSEPCLEATTQVSSLSHSSNWWVFRRMEVVEESLLLCGRSCHPTRQYQCLRLGWPWGDGASSVCRVRSSQDQDKSKAEGVDPMLSQVCSLEVPLGRRKPLSDSQSSY